MILNNIEQLCYSNILKKIKNFEVPQEKKELILQIYKGNEFKKIFKKRFIKYFKNQPTILASIIVSDIVKIAENKNNTSTTEDSSVTGYFQNENNH